MDMHGEKRGADSSAWGGDLPGAKVGKTGAQPVWVKVKGGGAVKYKADQMHGVEDVCDLLEKVKDKEQPKLDAVALGELKLYKSEADAADSAKADTPNKYTNRY